MTRYTYGDSDLAAERLTLVSAAFEPTSRAFLHDVVGSPPGLAIDLGCGPGRTTAMVHAATGARATLGIDASAAYVDRAKAEVPPGIAFAVHDATVVPFPRTPADLIYARLLLAHLPDPASIVQRWSTQLTVGGLLLLDDLEAIDTDEDVFRRYLDEVALEVVRREGGALLVGPQLHEMTDPADTDRVHDEVAVFAPAPEVTARIFAMNLAVLIERGETQAHPGLADSLTAIEKGRTHADPVVWRMRQVALRHR